jgi:hypothetical protein
MPGLLSFEQHRPIGQVETPCLESFPQTVIGPSVTELKLGESSPELGAQGELAAEGAAAVVNENQRHCAILAISPLPL